MKNFLKSAAFKSLIVVALFLLGIIVYAATTGGFATIPAAISGAIISPLQSLGAGISDGFENFVGIFTDSGKLRKENNALQSEINELRKQQVETDELRRQNELYREFLELKEQHSDYKFAHARVIYVDPSDKYGGFTINAGSLHGVSVNDPVIISDKLIGVVHEVGLNHAIVRSILHPDTQVSAVVSRTNSSGVTGGTLSLARENLLQLNYLTRDSGVATGDYVVTSGKGGVYPSLLLIGRIEEVKNAPDALTLVAVVKPFADIRNASDVFVLIGFNGKGELTESE